MKRLLVFRTITSRLVLLTLLVSQFSSGHYVSESDNFIFNPNEDYYSPSPIEVNPYPIYRSQSFTNVRVEIPLTNKPYSEAVESKFQDKSLEKPIFEKERRLENHGYRRLDKVTVSSSVSFSESGGDETEDFTDAGNNENFVDTIENLLVDMRPAAEVFLTHGNTEETVPLSSETRRDIIISPDMVRNGSQFNHVVLLCNASYPVEWTYDGVGAPRLYTTQIRTFGNFFNPKTYGHSVIVVLVQEKYDEQQTGTYTCRSIRNPSLQTHFHLYFKGEFGFPSLQNDMVRASRNDTKVMIPCPTTDPTATIGLYRIAPPANFKNLIFEESFEYDPKKGFSMNLSAMSSPYGSYVCKFNEQSSNWKIDLVPPKEEEVRVLPNSTVLKMNNLANHTFKCQAKEPIQIMLPNTVDFGTVTYSYNNHGDFPYEGVLQITPNVPIYSVANYFKVNCQLKSSRRVLHTWEYSNFGKDEIKISYDKEHKRLLCCSKSGLTPIHEMAKCETVTDCNIKKHCFKSHRCDYAFPPKFVDAPRGCTAIEFMNDFPSHVMKCSVGEVSQIMMVTSNIENDNLILYDDSMPDVEDILKLTVLKQTDDKITVQCVASIFYFSTNLIFGVQDHNGNIKLIDENLVRNVNSYGPIFETRVFPDLYKIICFAPLTRSTEWKNASLQVNLINSPTGIYKSEMIQAQNNNSNLIMTGLENEDQVIVPNYLRMSPKRNKKYEAKREEENSFSHKVFMSVKTSTSVDTYLRNKKGHLIKVLQDN